MGSLKSSSRVAVSLEGTVRYIGSLIDEIWHNWLVLRTVPWDISWLSHSISVAGLMILMENWSLSDSPFLVSIWDWRVLWQGSCQVPPEEIWVVLESSLMEPMIVHNDWSCISQTSSESLGDEEVDVEIGDPASRIEIFNWKFSNT